MALSISNSRIKQPSNKAFTLVELAIVLVIIGLIISGILVGQDLVRSAENRAIISQIDKYNAAVNSFRNKFNAIPGDFAQAIAYINTAAQNGDGNGILYSAAGSSATLVTLIAGASATAGQELVQFWYQLSQLSMIEGNYDGSKLITVLGTNFPLTKSNRGGIIAYGGTDSINYYHIGLTPAASTTITTANNLTTDSALLIDVKMDDGKADTGVVQARGGVLLEATASSSALGATTTPGCVVTASLSIYNTGSTGYLCQLRIKFM